MPKIPHLSGACHCGAVAFEVSKPAFVVACNCSLCRRYAALWAHGPPAQIRLIRGEGATRTYLHSDKEIAFHTCKTCGCITHWRGVDGARWAVNMRMIDPNELAQIPVRRFDGAESWAFLD